MVGVCNQKLYGNCKEAIPKIQKFLPRFYLRGP
jgi:hypothetical protein